MFIKDVFSCYLPYLSEIEFSLFLFGLVILLMIGNIAGKVSLYFKQPPIVGQLLLGCILGKSGLGYFFPVIMSTLFPTEGAIGLADYSITQLSVVMVMFLIGLDVSTKITKKNLYNLCIIDLTMILIPFLIGVILAIGFPTLFEIQNLAKPDQILFTIFLGVLFFVPPLAVIYHAIIELKFSNSSFSNLLLSAMGISEIVAWTIFAILVATVDDNHIIDNIYLLIIFSILYLSILLLFVEKPLKKILLFCEKEKINTSTVYLILCLLSCVLVTLSGLHFLIGAFAMGIAINNSNTVKLSYRKEIEGIVLNIFFPIFFLYIGLETNFITNFNLYLFLIILIACSTARYLSAVIAGWFLKKIHRHELNLIKGMSITRGATEIILAKMALKHNIINLQMFVAITLVALISSSIGSYIFMKQAQRIPKPRKSID